MNEKGLDTEKLVIGYDNDLIGDICINVRCGKIVTLIGPNGSGKSTLLSTVTGMLKKRGGLIFLDGSDKADLTAKETAKKLSVVSTAKVRPELMTCREVIESGRYPYTGITGRLSAEDKRMVDEAADICECTEFENTLFSNISDGQRQRVMLARAIAQQPAVLVLDEPTSYLDIKYRIDILSKIKRLAEEKNIAILMSLHEPAIAMKLSDTVVAIGDGAVMRIGSVKEVFTEEFIRSLYKLGDRDISLLGGSPWLTGSKGICEGETSFEKGVIFIQGTMSDVGKSLIAAGLCRIFAEDGYSVAPFKSQNMANNSCVTVEGLEMGRAQYVQARCAKTEPLSCMNPILLKPTDDRGSQVIVNGKPVGNMKATQYFEYRKSLVPVIKEAYDRLRRSFDIIVVEGAGSPAEINLCNDDIVNMGLARLIGAPVLLVGDIDRGGVFAQLTGTLDLLEKEDRRRVKGLIVNRFRGDPALFEDGIRMLEEKSCCPVAGVVPYMDIDIDDEDSLSERLKAREKKAIDIAVVRFPHISNFTDMNIFGQFDDVSVRYVSKPDALEEADIIILPGTKSTMADMKWLVSTGIAESVKEQAAKGKVTIGICGGYQMLGKRISDPYMTEDGQAVEGLGLLDVETTMEKEKTRRCFTGTFSKPSGPLSLLADIPVAGYEIHMGKTLPDPGVSEFTSDGSGYCRGNVYGSYVHGLFDDARAAAALIRTVAENAGKEGISYDITDRSTYMEKQYSLLADTLRQSLNMEMIYDLIGVKEK